MRRGEEENSFEFLILSVELKVTNNELRTMNCELILNFECLVLNFNKKSEVMPASKVTVACSI